MKLALLDADHAELLSRGFASRCCHSTWSASVLGPAGLAFCQSAEIRVLPPRRPPCRARRGPLSSLFLATPLGPGSASLVRGPSSGGGAASACLPASIPTSRWLN